MQAQGYDEAVGGSTRAWRTLGGGVGVCEVCANVGIEPVPAGTRRVRVGVVLPAGTEAGVLWLAGFETGGESPVG